ncbi:unnamed protein product [Caenorhabditis auriculariae]|uniref:TGF-beta family profile domain-containing protein n=1 Tax=Caenorhabditis auriculariae TaxID=2777116 RepID=A0A8S1HG21_9PELO|nr:unnamed protein product [Caenorhabditis auriculariae]
MSGLWLVLFVADYSVSAGSPVKASTANPFLVPQREATTIHPQCICVPSPTSLCQPYDSRMQATSLEEAISAFPDLSLDSTEHRNLPEIYNFRNVASSPSHCSNKQCKDCMRDIRLHLSKVGLLPTPDQPNSPPAGTTCEKYRFARKDEGLYHKITHRNTGLIESKLLRKRMRRQTPDLSGSTVLGTRFTLSCSSKGITPDSDGTVSLCSSCWVWRKLPSNYFPQYINELVCDNADRSCLSGYATCSTSHRTLEVVRNDSGILTTLTLSAGSHCDCRVMPTSVIEKLVTGEGVSSILPPVDPAT